MHGKNISHLDDGGNNVGFAFKNYFYLMISVIIIMKMYLLLAAAEIGSSENDPNASVYSDEGLDISLRLSESIFQGPDLDPESETLVLGKE